MQLLNFFTNIVGFASISDDAPALDRFTYRGLGLCANSEGKTYGYNSVQSSTIEECAEVCKSTYDHDDSFVGINFSMSRHPAVSSEDPTWNCNCMLADGVNGKISGAAYPGHYGSSLWAWGDKKDEICYSYDGMADNAMTDESDEVAIEGYDFIGRGWCANRHGSTYGLYHIVNASTLEECAKLCMETYSSDEYFKGFNADIYQYPVESLDSEIKKCKCMIHRRYTFGPGGNIMDTVYKSADKVCYGLSA